MASNNIFSGWLGASKPKGSTSVYAYSGVAGFSIFGGYLNDRERNPKLAYGVRYDTWADIVRNTSIVAAGFRYWLNLVSRPVWTVTPAKDIDGVESSEEAEQWAKFVDECLNDMETGWTRQVRRMAPYMFYGFYVGEWVAKKREDGLIGIKDIDPRPQHTIKRWEVDDQGKVLGVWQTSPQTGQEHYIERSRMIYIVDDALTDSPEGMGMLRQLTEPAMRLKEYFRLEGLGFSRDMRGLPVGRAPYSEINKAIANGDLTKEEAATQLREFENFVNLKTKDVDTALVLDSATYTAVSGDGQTITSNPLWDVQLISASTSGMDELGKAIDRVNYEMARIIGVEGLLMGASTGGANRSLGEDKSRNLYLQADASLDDMAEAVDRDIIGALWKLNGIDRKYRPTVEVETVTPKDIDMIGTFIRDVSGAGIMLERDDEAVKEMFQLAGLTPPEANALALMLGSGPTDDPLERDPLEEGDPLPEDDPPVTKRKRGRPRKHPKPETV